jgi:hypothetical protein
MDVMMVEPTVSYLGQNHLIYCYSCLH